MCYDDWCPGPKAYEGLIVVLEQIIEHDTQFQGDPWAADLAKVALNECKDVQNARA